MRLERSEPILPSRNLDETRAFYGKVGFTAWFQGRIWPGYEIMSRGHLVVHFFAEREPAAGGHDAGCYWRVKDADRFYEKCAVLNLASEGIPRLTAPVDQPWGMREFTLVDPSGNLVRVGHDLHDPRRFLRWPRWIGRR